MERGAQVLGDRLARERFGGDAATEGAAYGPLSGYSFQGDDDWGFGYVVGAAYEIPEKALRIALTFGSAIDFELDSTETFPDAVGGQVVKGTTEISMPKSVNLDFQTGIAPKTLLFGSMRWIEPLSFDRGSPVFVTHTAPKPVMAAEEPGFTSIDATTVFVSGSMRDRIPFRSVTAHTPPSPAA